MPEIRSTICRACHASCPVLVEFEDGKPTKVYGDKDDPIYHGYTCIKGRELPYYHTAPERLTTPMKMQADGTHAPISSETAMDEVAEKISRIVDEHGPRSVAIYIGTHGFNNFATEKISRAWMRAINSPMEFTSVTIDQPGKAVSAAIHGSWMAGGCTIEEADSWLLVGTNPIVSQFGGMPSNPARSIKKAVDRGAKLIVIDPRVTDVAKHAAIHLQPKPGMDPVILAGMMRVIFSEGLYDQEFVTQNVDGFAELQQAVDKFTPDYVEERADVPVTKLVEAARTYAKAARGGATAGTGPNMAGYGNLTEYMLLSLRSLCGHWNKEGEKVGNPGVLVNKMPALAQAVGPSPGWGFGEKLRVRGLSDTAAGLPTAALADEILMEGEGRVRVLISLGGNPMMAWPDQIKTHEALKKLDLFVSLDPLMTASGRLSHYVIGPKMPFEFASTSALMELLGVGGSGVGYQRPYAQYTPPLMEPPEGSDVIEDYEFFYGLAQRMGLQLYLQPSSIVNPAEATKAATKMDMKNKPTGDDMWDMLLKDSPVPLDEIRKDPSKKIYDVPEVIVGPKTDGWEGRLNIANDQMLAELQEAYDGVVEDREKEYAFRMISRRLSDTLNSSWHSNPRLTRRFKYNPSFMNPADASRLGLRAGDIIELTSQRASIYGVVELEDGVKEGCVAMTHCWGDAPGEDDDVLKFGSNTGRLTDNEKDYDPHTGIPRMSSIPVNIRLMNKSAAAAE